MICRTCKLEKLPTEMVGNGARPEWSYQQCRACAREYGRRRRATNPERDRQKARSYYASHRELENARSRAWRAANPDKYKQCTQNWYANNKKLNTRLHKNWQLKTDHRITLEEYEQRCAAQDNRCEICGKQVGKWKLRPDHDHKCCGSKKSCGKCLRGFICDRCNHILGHGYDDPVILRKAAAYLESYASTST